MKRTPLFAFILIVVLMPAANYAQQLSNQEPGVRSRRTSEQKSAVVTRYVVQIGTGFGSVENADQMVSRLQSKYPGAYTQSPTGSSSLYRVRIGPFDSRED